MQLGEQKQLNLIIVIKIISIYQKLIKITALFDDIYLLLIKKENEFTIISLYSLLYIFLDHTLKNLHNLPGTGMNNLQILIFFSVLAETDQMNSGHWNIIYIHQFIKVVHEFTTQNDLFPFHIFVLFKDHSSHKVS